MKSHSPYFKMLFYIQSLSDSNNSKLVHFYNIYHKINNHQVVSILLGSHVNIVLNIVMSNNVIYSLKCTKSMWQNQWIMIFMNELIYVVHQNAKSGLSPEEAKDILWL